MQNALFRAAAAIRQQLGQKDEDLMWASRILEKLLPYVH